MKQIYLPLVLILSFLATSNAQISLLSTDMSNVGDQIVRYIDSIPSYGPGSAGANQTWDFSGAPNEFTETTNVLTVGATPYASTFSGSSYAMQGNTNSYLYFTETASSFITDGVAGDLLGTGELIEAPFSPSLTLHEFPRTYADFYSDTYGFVAEADGSTFSPPVDMVRLTHTGTVYDTTDGYGTLITPIGSYNALRVKTTSYTRNIIEFKLFPFSSWSELSDELSTAVSYSWHAKQEKLAIAEYSYDSIGNPGRLIYSTVPPVINVGIVSNESSSKTFLYPQPANDRMQVGGLDATADMYTAEVYGIAGNKIWEGKLEQNYLDVSDLTVGSYLLRIRNSDGVFEETLRFVIQR